MNNETCWRNIPEPVWDYTIGGYQVLKKWLSYREKPLLGRGLNRSEIQHVTDTARRLAALIALQPALDANYRAVADAATTVPCHEPVGAPAAGAEQLSTNLGRQAGGLSQWDRRPRRSLSVGLS